MDDLRQRITDLMPVARDELAELVALRSVADPRQYPAEECERTAQWVLERFAGIGFSDARLEETTDGSTWHQVYEYAPLDEQFYLR